MSQYILDATASPAQLGGKAAGLARLVAAADGARIPAWFAVSPQAFDDSLTADQRAQLPNCTDGAAARRLLADLQVSAAVQEQLHQALAQLDIGPGGVAVRSSAVFEDQAAHSFAGQLDSFMAVPGEDVAARIADVWRSAFSDHLLAYWREHQLGKLPQAPAVLVQHMIAADVAGVAFGADPVSGRRQVRVVAAVPGLGGGLVSGESDADTFHVHRDGRILQREIAAKTAKYVGAKPEDGGDADGMRRVELDPAEGQAACLNDGQVLAVAELASAVSRHLGRPQDIEWAYAQGALYLLQARPITALAQRADPDGRMLVWDNSNIVESYGGITTPLTFSFARRAYEEVYRQFCYILRVPRAAVRDHADTFRHMLGLLRGRVYYNLVNWYRVLALLPGYQINRGFMEQMMGVGESLPAGALDEPPPAGLLAKLQDGWRLTRTVLGLWVNHLILPWRIRRFYQRLQDALAPPALPLDQHSADQLSDHYRDLERRLLTRWDAPLVNDFLAMIFFGIARKLSQKWCADADGSLQNDLLCGEGGIISAEPAKRVKAMARLAATDAQLVELLHSADVADILAVLPRHPALHQAYQDYIEEFGDRCLDELKLESATLHDDPLVLLRAVGQFAARLQSGQLPADNLEQTLRARAEATVAERLAGRPVRRALFRWVLRHTRARVRDRENLRFERTRLFGRVRRIFVELGKHLHAAEALATPRDVFYLEVEEVLGYLNGTATTTDLAALTQLRRRQFADYAATPAPADRFITHGPVHQGNAFTAATTAEPGAHDSEQRKGIACCPGVVRGRVRVITDPKGAQLEAGEILVAERTDPGWILLFAGAAGVLVERGSLLSHSAIVAREMGIPAVVSLSGVCQWLQSGDVVELDGSTGVVRRIQEPQQEGPADDA